MLRTLTKTTWSPRWRASCMSPTANTSPPSCGPGKRPAC